MLEQDDQAAASLTVESVEDGHNQQQQQQQALQPIKPWLLSPSNQPSDYGFIGHVNQPQSFASPFPFYHPSSSSLVAAPMGRSMNPPGWTALQGLQEGSQHLTNTLSMTMATVSNFVQLVDTTVYSAWSSLTSLLALISQLSNFHEHYIRGGLETVAVLLKKFMQKLFGYNHISSVDTRRIIAIILGMALALLYLVKRAINELQRKEFSRLSMSNATLVEIVAIHSFVPQHKSQLAIESGQRLFVATDDAGTVGLFSWLKVKDESGRVGFIPANYVTCKKKQ